MQEKILESQRMAKWKESNLLTHSAGEPFKAHLRPGLHKNH